MDANHWLTLGLSILAIIVIPSFVLLVRIVVKWTRQDSKLDDLIEDVVKLVESKDKVHQEIITQMREDRKAADQRLRWLEEQHWRRR